MTSTAALSNFKINKEAWITEVPIFQLQAKNYITFKLGGVIILGRKIMMMSRHCRVQNTKTLKNYRVIRFPKSLHLLIIVGLIHKFYQKYLLVKSLSRKPSGSWNLKNPMFIQHQYLQKMRMMHQYLWNLTIILFLK